MYKVLLADDESLIKIGLMALIDWEDHGFEIAFTAESGEEAIAYLKNHQIDLLITDILMGEMSGLELIQEAKEFQPHLKSIVLTGYQEFGFIKQGLLLGIENYLVKPVDEEELLTTIQSVGRKLNAEPNVKEHKLLQETTTLMDNTLLRLINGEIDKKDCLDRLSLYNIQFNQSYYTISILNFEHFSKSEIKGNIRSYIEEHFSTLCLFSPNQELIIIFGGMTEEEIIKKNQSLVNQLCEDHKGIGLFYLSMGKSVKTIDEFEDSYSLARENSMYQLYSEPNVLIFNNHMVDRQKEIKSQREFKENIVKGLLHANEETLEIIELFFNNFTRKSKFISPEVAKKYTFDLISYIHYSIKPDDLSHYTAAVEKMVYSSNIQELKGILRDYCHELILSINHQVNNRSPIVQNVLQFIHSHYDQGLSLKTLGQQFHVNAIYLGQLFQKEIGVVFSEYLNRYRLEKAKELLKTTQDRAGDIGKKVGYSDTTYFYKQFKKNVGTTPSEWRKI
ncbi:response regulator transcription factor [Heyndrickxia sp. FSL W8-0496]|uniref:response regulator transcription factor n=1 Tax=Heyndrickxia TaxID=2837504 RepID=UPI0030FBEEF4